MEAGTLFKRPAMVLLLLSELPGTSAGLHRRAEKLEPGISIQSVYWATSELKKHELIRVDGKAGRRGGGKRFVLTDAGREIALQYRRRLALAASMFPVEDGEVPTD